MTIAQSGDEAIAPYKNRPAKLAFDLVIVDMVMPGSRNGLNTIDALRDIRRDQLVPVASGDAKEQMDALVEEEESYLR